MDAIYPLISRLSQELSHSRRTVVAIDGPCASGKTTLAFNLIEMFGGSVISTDDFFFSHISGLPKGCHSRAETWTGRDWKLRSLFR